MPLCADVTFRETGRLVGLLAEAATIRWKEEEGAHERPLA